MSLTCTHCDFTPLRYEGGRFTPCQRCKRFSGSEDGRWPIYYLVEYAHFHTRYYPSEQVFQDAVRAIMRDEQQHRLRCWLCNGFLGDPRPCPHPECFSELARHNVNTVYIDYRMMHGTEPPPLWWKDWVLTKFEEDQPVRERNEREAERQQEIAKQRQQQQQQQQAALRSAYQQGFYAGGSNITPGHVAGFDPEFQGYYQHQPQPLRPGTVNNLEYQMEAQARFDQQQRLIEQDKRDHEKRAQLQRRLQEERERLIASKVPTQDGEAARKTAALEAECTLLQQKLKERTGQIVQMQLDRERILQQQARAPAPAPAPAPPTEESLREPPVVSSKPEQSKVETSADPKPKSPTPELRPVTFGSNRKPKDVGDPFVAREPITCSRPKTPQPASVETVLKLSSSLKRRWSEAFRLPSA